MPLRPCKYLIGFPCVCFRSIPRAISCFPTMSRNYVFNNIWWVNEGTSVYVFKLSDNLFLINGNKAQTSIPSLPPPQERAVITPLKVPKDLRNHMASCFFHSWVTLRYHSISLLNCSSLKNIDIIQKLSDILVFNHCGLLNQSNWIWHKFNVISVMN